jgi:hypothetical protein
MVACIVLQALVCVQGKREDVDRLLPRLSAGLAMVLALRCLLAGTTWPWLWLSLAFAGVAHAWDMLRRERG